MEETVFKHRVDYELIFKLEPSADFSFKYRGYKKNVFKTQVNKCELAKKNYVHLKLKKFVVPPL